ncbi:hypothetical protein MKZ42_09650 [Pseudoalteromonas shioyasakiensis]|uniref:Uncharacterized protein n=1 Tax=Pseudoalteromonas shioyasakiensis TaxID=1190813 RepID=A0ABT6U2H8_9GAMM|nr:MULTISPECIES: hypothetical protein [Pseudoalteromonas]MDI4670374.1 hypothetical protein [Pseudoalteromonas shioyasakiensis]MDI4673522.1 hypothetical protein [Pseudoalteromonas shioyasakiensis]MDI4687283.1 hypothetical protein [Pseudoalteromonas shioyasakiensis]MDI4705878.1 hypothetical protein [Pseudoalteromonas shioyasakiensis]NUJ23636.1 hypothetical protein [Pseudoalteromonas sp. 0802]
MLKGNYKAWIISIALHAVLLLLFTRYGKSVKLPAVAEPPKVINAYVSVDLTSLPSLQKIQEKPSPEQTEGMPDEVNSLPKNEKASQSSYEQISDPNTVNPTKDEPKKATSEVVGPNQALENSKITELPFKKLNPYAPIPQLNFENGSANASLFEQGEVTISNSPAGRVTVPAQLTVSDKATVVWQNGDGSKRIEVLNGMCYGIDFNSVFGKSGVPSGSPRPCEDKEAKLFKDIMNKWSKK